MMTRKDRVCIILIGVIITFVFCGAFWVCGNYEHHYTKDGKITSVVNDTVEVETTDGNLWEFDGKGYKVGNTVKVTFYDNATMNDIYDDEVTNCKIVVDK